MGSFDCGPGSFYNCRVLKTTGIVIPWYGGTERRSPTPHGSSGCATPGCILDASGGREQRARGSPSPPLEERVGERRPITIFDAVLHGDIPAGCRTNISGGLAENDGLLSLPLSSKGGEGNGAAAREHQDACKEQTPGRRSAFRRPPSLAHYILIP